MIRSATFPAAIAPVAHTQQLGGAERPRMENLGARRLHTVMAALMEDVLFELPARALRHGRRLSEA